MRLPRYGRAAQTAINTHLKEQADKAYAPLYTLSVIADKAAMDAGRKTELFPSLADYERVLPPASRTRWIQRGESDWLIATNPHYRGETPPELQNEHNPIPGPFDAATDAHALPQ